MLQQKAINFFPRQISDGTLPLRGKKSRGNVQQIDFAVERVASSSGSNNYDQQQEDREKASPSQFPFQLFQDQNSATVLKFDLNLF